MTMMTFLPDEVTDGIISLMVYCFAMPSIYIIHAILCNIDSHSIMYAIQRIFARFFFF